MSIKLYGPRMGSALCTHWTAAELGTAYEAVPIDFQKGEHKSDWFMKISPMGQVPALTDGEFALAESMAINSYLIDVAGSDLGGKDAQARAKAWQWSIWMSLNALPHLTALAMPMWTKQPLAADVEAGHKAALAKALPVLEAHLAANPYVAGADFTVGDIKVSTAMGYVEYSDYDLSAYPAIVAWKDKVTARPAYAAAKGAVAASEEAKSDAAAEPAMQE